LIFVLFIHNQIMIGLFDSGVGGISIWRELVRQLPNESTIYVADNANCPYGPRPVKQIKEMSAEIVRFLLDKNCRLIVVACNTASAAALHWLRHEFDVPFVGLEPAVKPAAQATRTGHIGILATTGTIQGNLFRNTSRQYANGVQVHVRVGEGLVEQIEAGQLDTPETEQLLRQHLEALLVHQVDQIALGCTHYPLLMPLIQRIVAHRATVIDPAPAVAKQVQRILGTQLAPPPVTHEFFATGSPTVLQLLVDDICLNQPYSINSSEVLKTSELFIEYG
jgi:glutamate racemase